MGYAFILFPVAITVSLNDGMQTYFIFFGGHRHFKFACLCITSEEKFFMNPKMKSMAYFFVLTRWAVVGQLLAREPDPPIF